MGSKREWEQECGSKTRFRSIKTAKRAASRLYRLGEGIMHAYRCKFCRNWHIGHPTGRIRK